MYKCNIYLYIFEGPQGIDRRQFLESQNYIREN